MFASVREKVITCVCLSVCLLVTTLTILVPKLPSSETSFDLVTCQNNWLVGSHLCRNYQSLVVKLKRQWWQKIVSVNQSSFHFRKVNR